MHDSVETIEFGTFPRVNDKDSQPIVWRVLNATRNKKLLITENAIDVMPFYKPLPKPLDRSLFDKENKEKLEELKASKSPKIFDENGHLYVDPFGAPITTPKYAGLPPKYQIPWEKSMLRKYLNSEFLRGFCKEEIARINTVTVTNGPSPINVAMPGGENTRDRVFLLDFENVKRYFPSDRDRMCKPTPYALAKAEKYQEQHYCLPHSNGCCSWWLRTVGLWEQFDPKGEYRPTNQHCVATVDHNGVISLMGMPADAYEFVRPVILINN